MIYSHDLRGLKKRASKCAFSGSNMATFLENEHFPQAKSDQYHVSTRQGMERG